MKKNALKNEILELCAEDNFGLWELWWPNKGDPKRVKADFELFIEVINELVNERQIYALNKTAQGFETTALELDRLGTELRAIIAGEILENTYWFGKPYSFKDEPTRQPDR